MTFVCDTNNQIHSIRFKGDSKNTHSNFLLCSMRSYAHGVIMAAAHFQLIMATKYINETTVLPEARKWVCRIDGQNVNYTFLISTCFYGMFSCPP